MEVSKKNKWWKYLYFCLVYTIFPFYINKNKKIDANIATLYRYSEILYKMIIKKRKMILTFFKKNINKVKINKDFFLNTVKEIEDIKLKTNNMFKINAKIDLAINLFLSLSKIDKTKKKVHYKNVDKIYLHSEENDFLPNEIKLLNIEISSLIKAFFSLMGKINFEYNKFPFKLYLRYKNYYYISNVS